MSRGGNPGESPAANHSVAPLMPLLVASGCAARSVVAFVASMVWMVPAIPANVIAFGRQVAPLKVDVDDLTAQLEENPGLERSLAEVKIEGVLRLLAAYVATSKIWRNGSRMTSSRCPIGWSAA